MPKSRRLITFERFPQIFLDFEREFNASPQEGNTTFSIESQKEEFTVILSRVIYMWCPLRPLPRVMSRVGKRHVNFLTLYFRVHNCCFNQAGMSSTLCLYGQISEDSIRRYMHLPSFTMNVFHADYISWPSFRDMFTTIYVNRTCLLMDSKRRGITWWTGWRFYLHPHRSSPKQPRISNSRH